jgi:hypothetical protein
MRSLCEHTVSAACLAFKEPHACIDELTEHVLAARGAVLPGPPHHAAVVVPAVCAGALKRCCACRVVQCKHTNKHNSAAGGTALVFVPAYVCGGCGNARKSH